MAVFAAYCSGGRCTGLQPAIPSTLRRGSVLSISKIVMQVEVLLFILLFLSVNRFELSGSSADLSNVVSQIFLAQGIVGGWNASDSKMVASRHGRNGRNLRVEDPKLLRSRQYFIIIVFP
jgi:hypothetical protein